MSFVQRFKDNKVKALTVKVKFPLEEPELEFEVYRVTTMELRELYKPILADKSKQAQIDLTFNMFDKLMTKIKDVTPLNGSEFVFDRKQLEELKNTFLLSDMIDFVNAYNEALEAEVKVSEKNA